MKYGTFVVDMPFICADDFSNLNEAVNEANKRGGGTVVLSEGVVL